MKKEGLKSDEPKKAMTTEATNSEWRPSSTPSIARLRAEALRMPKGIGKARRKKA